MTQVAQGKSMLMFGLVAIAVVIGFYVLNAPDQRSAGDKIGDAINQLGDRTPGEKLGDAVEGAGADLKKATD